MAYNDIVTATVSKHCRRDLTRERPRLVFGHILGAQRHSAACQLAGDRAQVRIWRTNQQPHPLRARRTGNDTRDELGVADCIAVHFPVARYQYIAHCLHLPLVEKARKDTEANPANQFGDVCASGRNFSDDRCQALGHHGNLRFILAFDHDSNHRLGTRGPQHDPASIGKFRLHGGDGVPY